MLSNNVYLKRFIITVLILQLPMLLALIEVPGSMLPALYWINIPVLWTGVALLLGESHFVIGQFGASPQSALAYSVIIVFWTAVAFLITKITAKLKPAARYVDK